MSTVHDQEEVMQGVRLIRRLSETEPIRCLIAKKVAPGLNIQNDEQMLAYFKEHCGSIYHPCGTCAMVADATRVCGRRTTAWSRRTRFAHGGCLDFSEYYLWQYQCAHHEDGKKSADLILSSTVY